VLARRLRAAVWALVCLTTSAYASADGGNAGGGHSEWSVDAVASFDLLANVSGGLDTGVEVPGTLDMIGDLLWAGPGKTSAHRLKLFVQGTVGGDFSVRRAGGIQFASDIEAPNTVKLFEAWYEYTLPEARGAVLLGLHDLNTVFYVVDRASLLLHSSFGQGPEVSQASPSVFPTTAPAAIVQVDPGNAFYVSAGVYDGIPGKRSDPYGTHIRFDDGDGVFAIAEAGLSGGAGARAAKAAFGIWHTTATFEDAAGVMRDENSGVYLIAEGPLPVASLGGDLGAFVQLGRARAGRNAVETYIGGGFQWVALFGLRAGDALSLGVAHVRLSDKYRRATAIRTDAETAVELNYAWRVNRWLVLQPDVQVVINPAATAGVDDAWIVGMRIVMDLP
jgi:porin